MLTITSRMYSSEERWSVDLLVQPHNEMLADMLKFLFPLITRKMEALTGMFTGVNHNGR